MSPLTEPTRLVLKNYNTPAAIAGVAPTLDYRFALDRNEIDAVSLTDKLTVTRAATTAVNGRSGYPEIVQPNVARFNHDLTTRQSLGLLLEESRSNFLHAYASPSSNIGGAIYSAYSDGQFRQDFNAHSWRWSSAFSNAELGWYDPGSISTSGNGMRYALSFWAKANQSYILRGNLVDERRQNVAFNFNLTTTWQYFSASTPANIVDDGTGTVYFRWLRGSAISVPAGLQIDFAAVNLERGGTPTSYIRTSGATATRTETAIINGSGVIAGSYTMIEKPIGCAIVDSGNIHLQTGYTTERVMVFPAALTGGQVTAIRSAM